MGLKKTESYFKAMECAMVATHARCATLPRAWNWVPNARMSALVEQHVHLSSKFGIRGAGGLVNRGRNGPWLLYFDGAQAFEKSHNANVSAPTRKRKKANFCALPDSIMRPGTP